MQVSPGVAQAGTTFERTVKLILGGLFLCIRYCPSHPMRLLPLGRAGLTLKMGATTSSPW